MIVPAIIAKDQKELDVMLAKLKGVVKRVQLDVMDGKFVPSTSLWFDLELPKGFIYEAHLMIENTDEWIKKNIKKADIFLPHFETLKNPNDIIDFAHKIKKKVGFVVNPETPISSIVLYLDKLDMVLIMTVNPGFYGSKFLNETLPKIKELRTLKPNLDIEVDGGINTETIKKVKDAGANIFVSGSFIMKNNNPGKAIDELKNIVEGGGERKR